MTKDPEKILTKLVFLLFSSILTITGWMAKSEISSMASTLKDIRKDVSELNTKSLLQEQEYKFKFEWIERKLTSYDARIHACEVKLKRP